MKKNLMMGVAVAALATYPAVAEVTISGEWMGGFMAGDMDSADGTTLSNGNADATTQPGAGSRSGNFFQESEIEFSADAEIMGDWKATVSITLEGEQQANQMDETFVRFSHDDYGTFELGNRDSAAHRMVPQAASAGFQPNGGAGNRVEHGLGNNELWLPNNTGSNMLTEEEVGLPTSSTGAGTGDATKLTYYTPRIFGFQLGASYTPDSCETGVTTNATGCGVAGLGFESQNDQALNAAGTGNAWSIGANQGIPLSMLGLDAEGLILIGGSYSRSQLESATLMTAGAATNANWLLDGDLVEWNTGAMIRVAGLQVSGAYKSFTFGDYGPDVKTYQIGATYQMGAWEAGVNYANGKAEMPNRAETVAAIAAHQGTILTLAGGALANANAQFLVNGSNYSFNGDDTMEAWEVAANYDMGAGVKLIGAIRYYDAEQANKAAAGTFEKTVYEVGTRVNF